MDGLSLSRIDDFRVAQWGGASIKLLKAHPTTAGALQLIAVLTNGWFIGRDTAAGMTASVDYLTLDLDKNPSITRTILIKQFVAIDVIVSDIETFRYSKAGGAPAFGGFQWIQPLSPIFNDVRPIVA